MIMIMSTTVGGAKDTKRGPFCDPAADRGSNFKGGARTLLCRDTSMRPDKKEPLVRIPRLASQAAEHGHPALAGLQLGTSWRRAALHRAALSGRPYSVETKQPVLTGIKARGCRTIHGRATVRRRLVPGVSAEEVTDARLPDGTCGAAWSRMYQWRRLGKAPLMWIWGQVEIAADDVIFRDDPEQPKYQAPALGANGQLERDLAGCKDFVAALADGRFAVVAYRTLAHLKWMKIGARAQDPSSCRTAG